MGCRFLATIFFDLVQLVFSWLYLIYQVVHWREFARWLLSDIVWEVCHFPSIFAWRLPIKCLNGRFLNIDLGISSFNLPLLSILICHLRTPCKRLLNLFRRLFDPLAWHISLWWFWRLRRYKIFLHIINQWLDWPIIIRVDPLRSYGHLFLNIVLCS